MVLLLLIYRHTLCFFIHMDTGLCLDLYPVLIDLCPVHSDLCPVQSDLDLG